MKVSFRLLLTVFTIFTYGCTTTSVVKKDSHLVIDSSSTVFFTNASQVEFSSVKIEDGILYGTTDDDVTNSYPLDSVSMVKNHDRLSGAGTGARTGAKIGAAAGTVMVLMFDSIIGGFNPTFAVLVIGLYSISAAFQGAIVGFAIGNTNDHIVQHSERPMGNPSNAPSSP